MFTLLSQCVNEVIRLFLRNWSNYFFSINQLLFLFYQLIMSSEIRCKYYVILSQVKISSVVSHTGT